MAKPLTQKQLKAMLEKTQAMLQEKETQLASLEQTYEALTGKAPLPTVPSAPSKLAAGESGAIGAAQMESRAPVNVPEGSTAARLATETQEALAARDAALADPLLDSSYERGVGGLSPAQLEARQGLLEAQKGMSAVGLTSAISTSKGSAGQIETPPETGLKPGYEWYAVKQIGGGVEWKQRRISGFTTPVVSGGGGGGFVETPKGVFGSVEGTSTARTLGRDQFKNSLALFFGAAEAAKPWVDALYDVVLKFYRSGSDVDESFNLALQDARNNPALKPFTDRFKGVYALQDLKLTGKPVLVPTIAEYVVSQAKMGDVLREANLGDLATDDFTTELISKGNSVTTIAEKIAKAYQRIDMAPKAIKDTFSRFFPTVDKTKLARTLLLGEKGVNELVDELETFEALAAAEQQGLGAINRIGGVDLGRAQEYARSGQTYASLTPQFSKIARALPTTTKLSQISKVEDIGQVGLEKALISQSAKELEQLELLGEQEIARLSGKAGRAELGLASQRRANRAF